MVCLPARQWKMYGLWKSDGEVVHEAQEEFWVDEESDGNFWGENEKEASLVEEDKDKV